MASPPAARDDADEPVNPTRCAPSSTQQQYCLGVGKKPPKQVQYARVSFEPNGCASPRDVRDNCNGVSAVLSGPVRRGTQCCYEICQGTPAPCGRLLLDAHGAARVAPVAASSAWSGTTSVPMPAAARAGWLTDAQLEHASVAAFSRFSLELLAIGAPAAFVEDAHRAALDEIEHARLCFALASAAGEPRGPGALSLRELPLRHEIADVVRAAAEECCCGETFAALVARRALAGCTHAGARRALQRIVTDEARHAELGWRFVAWAVAHFGADVRAAAQIGFQSGLARLSDLAGADASLAVYGRLDTAALQRVAREARDVLIEPLAAALAS